ncbi:hypothetical protein EAG_05944 [Camponotus floridanus]|uniref:Uncharacterized protein n=1 Tax=Camponotus floridanus TaxID=104421 RepID=E2AY44_CAMFO|nr:hypothetical protein EAG_05944 [Camponotus floridanus]
MSGDDGDGRKHRRCQEVPRDSLGRKVGAGDGGATRRKGREVLVAPYARVHLTRKRRRWCAAVRRGRHTKSAGYSGHVAQAGTGPGFPRERLAYHLRPPSRLLFSATATLCQAPAFCSFADSTSW